MTAPLGCSAAQREHGPLGARLLEEAEHGFRTTIAAITDSLELPADRRQTAARQEQRNERIRDLRGAIARYAGRTGEGRRFGPRREARLCIAATEATTDVGRELVGDILGRTAWGGIRPLAERVAGIEVISRQFALATCRGASRRVRRSRTRPRRRWIRRQHLQAAAYPA